MTVKIQSADFDISAEIAALRKNNPKIGAVASFIGVVRDVNEGDSVSRMTLEHYPGMTEKSIEAIVTQARSRGLFYTAGFSASPLSLVTYHLSRF